MEEKRTPNGKGEVLLTISSEETPNAIRTPIESLLKDFSSIPNVKSCPNTPLNQSKPTAFMDSPEISQFNPTRKAILRKTSLTRSHFSKPKSRFAEQEYALDARLLEEEEEEETLTQQEQFAKPISTPKTPFSRGFEDEQEEDEMEEVVKKVKLSQEKHNKVGGKIVAQWILFLCIFGCFIASLTIDELKTTFFWGLEFWKWCVLVLVTFSGMLVTDWFIFLIVFMIERNFLLKKKVLYFVFGLKKSVQVFIWIALVLLSWVLLFKHRVKASEKATKILNYITWTLISLLIGSFLWVVKSFLLKFLASNFHVDKFFDRIQESIFHQYVLQTLSGPPLIEQAEKVGKSTSMGRLSFRKTKKGKFTDEKRVIDMGMLHKIKQEKVSAWTMKGLVDAVTSFGASTLSNALKGSVANEMEAIAAANHIFRNVAKPGSMYVDEDDLLRFMIKEEVDLVFPLFGSSDGQIDRNALTEFVVKVYKDRKMLSHALSDTKTAVKQLKKVVTGILLVVCIVIWLLVTEIATIKVLVLISSQLVVAAFVFGNACQTTFEAIIFVFVSHPFDVGDRCVVDGVPLLVEEMNILSTVFLKLNNEKLYYPNSELATKPITNYYRSPDMKEIVEFSIDFSTPVEKIALFRQRFKKCVENNPLHWHPNHSVLVKEIEKLSELKMAVYCTHTMNYQEYPERNKRRSELIIEMKKIFEELTIKYSLLPQEVHLKSFVSEPIALI